MTLSNDDVTAIHRWTAATAWPLTTGTAGRSASASLPTVPSTWGAIAHRGQVRSRLLRPGRRLVPAAPGPLLAHHRV